MEESEILNRVSRDYRNIFEKHQSGQQFTNSTTFINPWVPRNVENSEPEEVFSCFAQKLGSKNVVLYFISREYMTKGPVYNSTGRFVFVSVEEELRAIAFVEEPLNSRVQRPRSNNRKEQIECKFREIQESTCWYI